MGLSPAWDGYGTLLIQKHPGTESSAPVRMLVVRIGHMGVRVPDRIVMVPMAVRTHRHGGVPMQVVAVVVRVGVLVIHGPVLVGVGVALQQVQQHAG